MEAQMSLITLEPNYKPSNKEEYMCDKHLEYFRQKLLDWRAELVKESSDTLQDLKETNLNNGLSNA
jgi:DnaK suppressor protein